MSETSLKFGPEWLRVLSHGNLSSPPSSPGPIKFKLADYRYGREEMLQLYSKDIPPPDGLHNLGSLYLDRNQEPLAFLPMNGEEQQIWQRSGSSDQVLRGPGRAPINGVGRGRGGSVERGRGRGRGVGAPYYNRGLSYDEECEIRGTREAGPPGMPVRNKNYERSQSSGDSRAWASERNPLERPTGIGEERSGAVSPKKGRAAIENWRSRGVPEEKGDSWRGVRNDKWGNRGGGWRERELDGEWEEGRTEGSTRIRNSTRSWDADREKDGHRRQWDENNLPEWVTENAEDKGGSFDAIGNFHTPGSSDVEEEDDREDERENGEEDTKNELGNQHHEELSQSKSEAVTAEDPQYTSSLRDGSVEEKHATSSVESSNTLPKPVEPKEEHNFIRENSVAQHSDVPVMNGVLSEEERIALCSSPVKKEKKKKPNIITSPPPVSSSALHISVPEVSSTILTSSSVSIPVTAHAPAAHPIHSLNPLNQVISTNSILQPSSSVHMNMHIDRLREKLPQMEEDNLEHMQSVADDLVAKLVEDDEPRMRIHQPPPGGFIPLESISHPPPESQWYYTDPQGDIQGPFSSADMNAWYKTGYFRSTLLLRRQCDDKFAQLGDLMKVFGRVPFTPGPPVPPLKVSELLNAQKVQAERERYEMMQAQAQLLQKQMYQQQNSLRQQQQQQQQQQHAINSMQGMEEWNHLNSSQQHQLYMQQMMGIPPIVPPSMPVSLHNSATTTNGHPPPSNAELRSSLSSSNTPPLSQHPDPIQAFVAQMATSSSSNITTSTETPLVQPPPSNSPIGGENPLQKLILQLQRGTQSGVGGGLATPGANPLISGHQPPSSLGTIPTTSLGLEKSPDQFDAIQSLMSQLTKMQIQAPDTMQQEDPRIREEEQKRIEEERRQFEEQKRAEEERIKLQELRLQEERLKEEERRRELEAKNQRLEEELRRIQEEQERRKKREEENKMMREAENKRKMEQQQQKNTEASKRDEEHKRQQQQLKQKQKQEEEAKRKEEARKMEEVRKTDEEARRKEEQRIREEQQQKIKEEKKKEEEERKRSNKEKERQQQIQVQEEMRRIALEEERKRMQQLAEEERKKQQQEEQVKQRQQKKAAAMQEQAKATPPAWNNTPAVQEKNNAPSLAEIQKTQELKERKEREAEAQREAQRLKEAQRQAAEEKKKQEANLKWASRVSQNSKGNSKPAVGQPPEPPVKSLIEIQKEEEKEMKKRKQKEMADRASALSHLSLNAAGVWGSAAQSLSWANRASSGAAPVITISSPQVSQPAWGSGTVAWSAIAQSNINTTSSGWNTETTTTYNQNTNQNMGGFWESPDTVKYGSGKGAQSGGVAGTSNSNRSPPKASTANHCGSTKTAAGPQAVNSNNKVNKKKNKDENETVKKIFVDNITPADNFTQWCKTSLAAMKIAVGIDIPTFVGFLADVESPYEVHDYIRSYLGDSKEVKEFAKQYLERRSKARDAQKERHEEDNILAPAPAVNPASTLEFQEVKTRLKRGRKKMQKVDSSILGFNSGAMERVDIDDE